MSLAEIARKLANDLFFRDNGLESHCQPGQSCIENERLRPLNVDEKGAGWVQRPFFAYETERMCNSCAAYFHAERCAQVLHEIECTQRRLGAIQGRN